MSKDESALGQVHLRGGGAGPYLYQATLRAALRPESDYRLSEDVVETTAALRVLSFRSTVVKVDLPGVFGKDVPMHLPGLMRVHASGEPGSTLTLGEKTGELVAINGRCYGDVLAAPDSDSWPDQDVESDATDVPMIEVPALRILAGAVEVGLNTTGDELGNLLGLKNGHMLGGMHIAPGKLLALTLVAAGIEFDGDIADPTDPDTAGRIRGRFRLESDGRAGAGYLLRLVAADNADALAARLAAPLAALAEEHQSPLQVVLARPAVPPLLWPLRLVGGRLTLIPCETNPAYAKMELAPGAATIRLRSRSSFPGEEQGLAAVMGERLRWLRTTDGMSFDILAGTLAQAPMLVRFTRAPEGWRSDLTGILSKTRFSVPLQAHAERLRELYRAANTLKPADNDPPYLYLPLVQGCLQLAMPDAEAAAAASTAQPASVLTGRLVAAAPGAPARAVSVLEAAALQLTFHWSWNGPALQPTGGDMLASGVLGSLRGFLYAFESSPNAQEALPDLRRGPAATRELPLLFGTAAGGINLRGKVDWNVSAGDIKLDFDPVASARPSLAWIAPGANAFITNHPLTRSRQAVAEPSVSRALAPLAFQQAFTLSIASRQAAPKLGALPGASWAHGLFDDQGPGFRRDTLVLPALPGVEFTPASPHLRPQMAAALRFDLPQLDELFAWSDAPREKDGAGPGATDISATVVTSLYPKDLADIWEAGRRRIALTRTQGAFAAGWILADATDAAVAVTGLVSPYTWSTSLRVDWESGFGSYTLAGSKYAGERALIGMQAGEFGITDGAIAPGAGPIKVAGLAASVYERAGLHWDSRGFGLAAAAAPRRAASLHLDPGSAATQYTLLTMRAAVQLDLANDPAKRLLARLDGPLWFYARDLPLDGDTFDGLRNPIESGEVTGQHLTPQHLGRSVHEWRLFQQGGLHEITAGPFSFKPLRLRRARFEGQGLVELEVLGAMWLQLGGASAACELPFGPDEIYRQGDPVVLRLERGTTGRWTHAWLGEKPALAPQVTSDISLACACDSGVDFVGEVPAVLSIALADGAARLQARLFGQDAQVNGAAREDRKTGIEVDLFLKDEPLTRVTSVCLVLDKMTVRLKPNGSTLAIDAALLVLPDLASPASEDHALAVVRPTGFIWLDHVTSQCAPVVLEAVHASGHVHVSWKDDKPVQRLRLLFGLYACDASVQGQVEAFSAPGNLTKVCAMASAWARIACKGSNDCQVEHRLLEDGVARRHELELDAALPLNSRIEWPLDGFVKIGSAHEAPWRLDDTADPWNSPELGKAPLKDRVRQFRIAADAGHARHRVLLQLRGQLIDAARLRRRVRIGVAAPLDIQAVVEHVLSARMADGTRARAGWTSLDYLTVTSARLLQAGPSDATFFAARYRSGEYRAVKHFTEIAWPGLIPRGLALSGLHDRDLARMLWKPLADNADSADQPFWVGGALIEWPLEEGAGAAASRSLMTVLPWAALRKTPQRLRQRGGDGWRSASAESWALHALRGADSLPAVRLGTRENAAVITERTRGTARDPLLIEQNFFEKWRSGKALPMGPGDLAQAPWFLRSALALARRWSVRDERWPSWSLLPVDAGKERGNGALRVEVRDVPGWQTPYQPALVMLPADLAVLSRQRARWLPAHRSVPQAQGAGRDGARVRALLVERGRDVERRAELAIETVRGVGEPVVARLPRDDACLESPLPQRPGWRHGAPSAALGWPSATGLDGLDSMGATLGEELPVLAPTAGFSARIQRLRWPAAAASSQHGGYFISFGNRIAFDYGTPPGFAGPAARHLLPAPARKRMPPESPAATQGPLLLPGVERMTVGRRPGVIDIATVAVTVAGDRRQFDPEHRRFGIPANSGPVVVQQLRSPRAPALPSAADDEALAALIGRKRIGFDWLDLRRRTYVSRHDLVDGQPALFKRFDGPADVVRLGADGLRVAFQVKKAMIGPSWSGILTLQVDTAPAHTSYRLGAGTLQIGSRVFNLTLADLNWACAQPDEARRLLEQANADTPLRLSFDVLPEPNTERDPPARCVLPLTLDPGTRVTLPLHQATIVFGDPAYDRQLSSQTANDPKRSGTGRFLLAADRKRYDRGATLYLAAGQIDDASGEFIDSGDKVNLHLSRVRPSTIPGQPAIITPLASIEHVAGAPLAVVLELLAESDQPAYSALRTGDTLLIEADVANVPALQVQVEIVAEPVLAPAPAVYSVLARTAGGPPRIALHAAAPLPQRVEFPALARGLALGLVERRALFVWRWAAPLREDEVHLLKHDRSGAGQLP